MDERGIDFIEYDRLNMLMVTSLLAGRQLMDSTFLILKTLKAQWKMKHLRALLKSLSL